MCYIYVQEIALYPIYVNHHILLTQIGEPKYFNIYKYISEIQCGTGRLYIKVFNLFSEAWRKALHACYAKKERVKMKGAQYLSQYRNSCKKNWAFLQPQIWYVVHVELNSTRQKRPQWQYLTQSQTTSMSHHKHQPRPSNSSAHRLYV